MTAANETTTVQAAAKGSAGIATALGSPSAVLAATFQLLDAVPARRMYQLQQGIDPDDRRRLFNRVEPDLDRGLGCCWLREDRIAATVRESLLHDHGQRYKMHAWVIMPNHVHCLVEPLEGNTLGRILGGIKGFSANRINKLLQRSGGVWLANSFITRIRHEEHLDAAREYIHSNPVNAGLCELPEQWKWSSAS